jgi:hypothetical protein
MIPARNFFVPVFPVPYFFSIPDCRILNSIHEKTYPMKKNLLILFFLSGAISLQAQITTPVIRAGFGVDAELRANYFNGFVQSGNDDWFNNGTAGTGNFIIDTTGAASLMAQYVSNPNSRKLPFYRTMRFPAYSVVNNRMLIDAIFTRDYHGDDSTIFAAGSNKNGMSPVDWSCPVSQSIPDKNDILDMMVHVRRAGPNKTDSLWMFGGVSIENTTGNRYFDFEMYQTDIYYDRTVRKFFGYGPDEGHTSWKFDAAGNVTQPGDIIFTAEYSSSSLTLLQARIWIDKASLSITPASFNWSGLFDGASSGAQFGYASILPKTAGAFYTGLQSGNNTWPGPFGAIIGNNTMPATYTARQYMEFSVNLTKLGLDPVTLLGGNACGMAFRRVLVKSRASTSFTSELKDFVGPFDFFMSPKAQAAADISLFCGVYGVSTLQVTNPVSTSVYEWSTTDGNIVGTTSGPSVFADLPGSYVVTQKLQSDCPAYALDTVVITFDPFCSLLENNLSGFTGRIEKNTSLLKWTVLNSSEIKYFEIERSTDGYRFSSAGKIYTTAESDERNDFQALDNLGNLQSPNIFYRLKIVGNSGTGSYSKVIRLTNGIVSALNFTLVPNPVKDAVTLNVTSSNENQLQVHIYNIDGKIIKSMTAMVHKGTNTITMNGLQHWQSGVYVVKIILGKEISTTKMVVMH